jgi:hypothetical protein
MFTGLYKVYRNGELVAEQNNSITKAGKAIILKSIMGSIPTIGGSIQAGIGTRVNTAEVPATGLITDTSLQFSICSSPVSISYLDNSGNFDSLVFKTSIPNSANFGNKFSIYELGLYPLTPTTNQGFYDTTLFSGSLMDNWNSASAVSLSNALVNDLSKSCYTPGVNIPLTISTTINSTTATLSSYTNVTAGQFVNTLNVPSGAWITAVTGTTSITLSSPATATGVASSATITAYDNFKVGDTALFIKGGETISVLDAQKFSNLGIYSSEDTLSIAYSKLPTIAPNVTIKFLTNSTNYYTFTFAISDTTSYGILTQGLSSAVSTGSPSWTSIKSVEMSATSNICIDAIRINDNGLTDNVTGLVSRTVLANPIVKAPGDAIDIEYYLAISFNKTVV